MVKNQQYEYLEGKEEKFQIEVSMKKPYGQLPQAQYLHRSRGGDALTQNLIDRNTSVACAVRTFTLFSLITLSHDWNPAQASAFNMQRSRKARCNSSSAVSPGNVHIYGTGEEVALSRLFLACLIHSLRIAQPKKQNAKARGVCDYLQCDRK